MVLRTYKGHFTDVSLNNNTPVHTEVLWGPGGIERLLWWGLLRTSAPASDYDQHVLDVDITIVIEIAGAILRTGGVLAQHQQ